MPLIGSLRTAPALIAMVASAAASASDPSVLDEIAALREELKAYRATLTDQANAPFDAEQAAAMRDLIQDVLSDAASRTSLQSDGFVGGWDNGFQLRSADGAFLLKLSGYGQFRWLFNRIDDPPTGDRKNGWGFEVRRTYVQFDGHLIDPSLTYRVQSDVGRSDGTVILQDAYIRKDFGNGFTLQGGQAKLPLLRETLVGDTGLLAIERSLVDAEFGARRTQGVFAGWSNDWLRFVATYCNGIGQFNRTWLQDRPEWAFAGRAEMKFGGEWSQFNDLVSFPGEPLSALFGVAAVWQEHGPGLGQDDIDVTVWTVDGEIDFGGANIFAAFVGRHIQQDGPSLDQFGLVVQGGFFILPEVELFARYEWGDSDNDQPDLGLVTGGANWYIARQRLKISADVGYGIEPVSATFARGQLGSGGGGAGWRFDQEAEDGQFLVRTQLQFAF